jgi:hypothetical protein
MKVNCEITSPVNHERTIRFINDQFLSNIGRKVKWLIENKYIDIVIYFLLDMSLFYLYCLRTDRL